MSRAAFDFEAGDACRTSDTEIEWCGVFFGCARSTGGKRSPFLLASVACPGSSVVMSG